MEYIKKVDLLSSAVEVEYLGRPRLMVSVAKIGQIPAIEVVRCKECAWNYDDTYYCALHEHMVAPNAFCSHGERRNNEQVD